MFETYNVGVSSQADTNVSAAAPATKATMKPRLASASRKPGNKILTGGEAAFTILL